MDIGCTRKRGVCYECGKAEHIHANCLRKEAQQVRELVELARQAFAALKARDASMLMTSRGAIARLSPTRARGSQCAPFNRLLSLKTAITQSTRSTPSTTLILPTMA